ncbi:MAG: hypothetical protein IKW45_03735 [Clostridia bacterium]|nr:hypothetical protein [Clostridia bacterium]
MTNYEKIKNMTVDEMAAYFDDIANILEFACDKEKIKQFLLLEAADER